MRREAGVRKQRRTDVKEPAMKRTASVSLAAQKMVTG